MGVAAAGASAAGAPVVAVDANGADLGPAEVAAGAAIAAQQGARVLLFGPAEELGPAPPGVTIIDAPVSIAKAPDPVRAAHSTPDASIVLAAKAVASGEAQALVCAGATGAALAASTMHVRRAHGIYRPALALSLPVPEHPVTLLDVGAFPDVRREHLVQFAFMGAALAPAVPGVQRPRVGLLSNGVEVVRGSSLVLETHAELVARVGADTFFDFVGNVEGGDLVSGAADVVVTDGFTGNIALKLMEGVSLETLASIRRTAMSSRRARLGGLLMRPALRSFRDAIDPEAQGGAYLLGLRQLGVVAHGRFTRRGFAQAILHAQRGAVEDVVERTHAALAQAGVLKVAPVSAVGSAEAAGVGVGSAAASVSSASLPSS